MPVARCEKSQWAFLLAQIALDPFPRDPVPNICVGHAPFLGHHALGQRQSRSGTKEEPRLVGRPVGEEGW